MPTFNKLLSSQREAHAAHSRNGYLAGGEYTHALRLTSELVDLRAAYANPACTRKARTSTGRCEFLTPKKKRGLCLSFFLVRETGIEPVR